MLLGFLVIIAALFILSAFWSGTETALTSLSNTKVKKLITMYPARIVTLRYWLEKPYYILTIILVGNTLTNIGISFFATIWAITLFSFIPRSIIEFATWLIVTFMLLIFGEITPKVYARRHSEMVSIVVLPIYEFLIKIAGPLISVMEFIFKFVAPGKRIEPFSRLTQLSIDELRQVFSDSDTASILGADTSAMVEKVFKLGEIEVSNIMTRAESIEGICLDYEGADLLDRFIETGRSRIPIVKNDPFRITGYVHIKDILKHLSSNKETFDEKIIRGVYIVPSNKKVSQLLKEFQVSGFQLAVVSNEDGKVIGLVTLEDILEELVGEIVDEYDRETDKVTSNQSIRVQGHKGTSNE